MKKFILLGFAALFAMMCNVGGADLQLGQTAGIDFGATASTDPNTTWNSLNVGGDNSTPGSLLAFETASIGDLQDTNGAASGVSFGLTNNSPFWVWDFGNGDEGDGGIINDASVFGDGVISNDAPGADKDLTQGDDFFTFTFSGLDDSLAYDFVGGYSRTGNINFDGTWTAGGEEIITDSMTGEAGGGFAMFSQLGTDGNGNLTIELTGETIEDGSQAAHIVVAAITLTAVEPGGGGVSGDFDGNGFYECADVDALVLDIAAGNNSASFDLDGNGVVDAADLTAWLAEAGAVNNDSGNPYLPGDANLDGSVDVGDFNVWNASKFTTTPAWCSGDFSADGSVDVGDFNIWNANKFTSSDTALVPEPSSFGMLMISLLFAIRLARRRNA